MSFPSMPDEAATADLSGRLVGSSYVLVCPVGHGATGTVWRGIDRATGTDVAVKLLHEGLLAQPKLVTRFVQERTILMMMRHENIVGVRDLFSMGGTLALVMDYVAGGSLRNRLAAAGTLPPAEAARLLAQVAAGLAQAHELGVVHRDVKPDNILLQEVDGRHEVRLTDFGIARVQDGAGLTTPQAIVGTPHYMAPEAIHGGAEPASDVYSAGIVLYELVTGHPPYGGEPLAVLRRHVEERPAKPAGLPHPVWALIEWCLDKDPARRPTAPELGAALRDLARQMAGVSALAALTGVEAGSHGMTAMLGGAHPSVRPVPRRRPRNGPRSWMWRRPGLMIALVAAAVAVPGLTGLKVWQLIGAGPEGNRPAALAPGTVPEPESAIGTRPATGATVPGGPAGAKELSAVEKSAAVLARARRPDAAARPSATTTTATAAVPFGPWFCGDEYSWDLGHPVLARPCHSLGPAVRVTGQMEATPGVQVDIALTIRDANTDAAVAGPYTCKGLMFTDFALEQRCGPVDFHPPRGGRYVVTETWEYTARPLLPGGSARGPVFDW